MGVPIARLMAESKYHARLRCVCAVGHHALCSSSCACSLWLFPLYQKFLYSFIIRSAVLASSRKVMSIQDKRLLPFYSSTVFVTPPLLLQYFCFPSGWRLFCSQCDTVLKMTTRVLLPPKHSLLGLTHTLCSSLIWCFICLYRRFST